jgi:cytochrome c biogenesis protein CcmG/thiol:disulfide interchange protein DsbE
VTPEPGAAPDPGAAAPGPGVPPEAAVPPPGWRGRIRALRRPRVYGPAAAVAAVIVALAVAGATVGSGTAAPQNYGQAKNFTLSVLGHAGQHLSLQSMAGRPVIVNFFASWCGPCQRETPMIARFYRDDGGRPAIIGVDVNDSASAAMRFVRKAGVTYPVVADLAQAPTAIAYDLPGLPDTFFLNSHHVIVKRVFGAVTQAELTTGARLTAGRAG